MFSPRSFMVSGLTFRSLINIEFILRCEIMFSSHCFTCSPLVFPTPFLEKIVFSPLYVLLFFTFFFVIVTFFVILAYLKAIFIFYLFKI